MFQTSYYRINGTLANAQWSHLATFLGSWSTRQQEKSHHGQVGAKTSAQLNLAPQIFGQSQDLSSRTG